MDKYTLNRDEAALLIIDIQERLVPAMLNGEAVIRNNCILLEAADAFAMPVLLTEQYPRGLGGTVAEISEKIGESPVFEKISYTALIPEVLNHLEGLGRKKIIVTGMETHVCVFQTVRDLLEKGYQVFLASDAVASRTKSNYKNGLALMSQMGAVVTNTETIVFDLLKQAGTPEFKRMSKLIK